MRAFASIAMRWHLWPRVRQILKERFEPREEKNIIKKVVGC